MMINTLMGITRSYWGYSPALLNGESWLEEDLLGQYGYGARYSTVSMLHIYYILYIVYAIMFCIHGNLVVHHHFGK